MGKVRPGKSKTTQDNHKTRLDKTKTNTPQIKAKTKRQHKTERLNKP